MCPNTQQWNYDVDPHVGQYAGNVLIASFDITENAPFSFSIHTKKWAHSSRLG